MADPLVQVRGLKKSFGTTEVLHGVDLDVHKGEVVSLIGASGSGKTTLLRCVNLLETYDGGSIRIDGVEVGYREAGSARRRRGERELAPIRADTGMVFQLFNLFPHLTAVENVMLGLRKVRGSRRPRRGRAPSTGSRASASPTSSTACRPSFPAASSSASASPAPSRWSRRSCCSTRSPRRSIPSWSARCSTSCASWPRRHDDAPGHARDGVRARCRRAHRVHGRRPHRPRRHARGGAGNPSSERLRAFLARVA